MTREDIIAEWKEIHASARRGARLNVSVDQIYQKLITMNSFSTEPLGKRTLLEIAERHFSEHRERVA